MSRIRTVIFMVLAVLFFQGCGGKLESLSVSLQVKQGTDQTPVSGAEILKYRWVANLKDTTQYSIELTAADFNVSEMRTDANGTWSGVITGFGVETSRHITVCRCTVSVYGVCRRESCQEEIPNLTLADVNSAFSEIDLNLNNTVVTVQSFSTTIPNILETNDSGISRQPGGGVIVDAGTANTDASTDGGIVTPDTFEAFSGASTKNWHQQDLFFL